MTRWAHLRDLISFLLTGGDEAHARNRYRGNGEQRCDLELATVDRDSLWNAELSLRNAQTEIALATEDLSAVPTWHALAEELGHGCKDLADQIEASL